MPKNDATLTTEGELDSGKIYLHESRCPQCGKMLTKSMLRVTFIGTTVEYDDWISKAHICVGAETKCKACYRVFRTSTEIKQ